MKNYLLSNISVECFFYFLGDVAAIFVALHIWANPLTGYSRIFMMTILLYLPLFFICDLFDVQVCRSPKRLFYSLATAFTLSALPLLIYSIYSMLRLNGGGWKYLSLLGITLCFIFLWRLVSGSVLPSIGSSRKVFIIGNTFNGKKLMKALKEHPSAKYRLMGIVEARDSTGKDEDSLGKIEELPKLIDRYKPEVIVIALDERRGYFPAEEFLGYKLRGIEIYDVPDFYEQLTGKILVNRLRPSWLLFTSDSQKKTMPQTLKRLLDITLSSLLLLLTSPVMLLSALLIKLDSRGPVLFTQERLGEGEKIFNLYKLRSMRVDAEQNTGPLCAKKNDQRITRAGRFLRQTRLDELPQLVNVFKGEMSLVGPRPERPFFARKLDEVIPYYRQRFIIKPGVTGWAAVNYRYCNTPMETGEKLGYDLFYIKHMSLLLDLFIILKTTNIILFKKGAL